MYKHKSNAESKKDEENDELENKDDCIDDDETFHDDKAEQEDENDKLELSVNDKNDESMNRTFSNPSQGNTSEKKFKCENCDFGAERK